jgi:hypothetical protein
LVEWERGGDQAGMGPGRPGPGMKLKTLDEIYFIGAEFLPEIFPEIFRVIPK